MYGYIPEEIAIVHSGKHKISRGWIDLERDKEQELVIPAFPLDPSNEKKMKTAIRWAKSNKVRGTRVKDEDIEIVRRKNEPFTWFRIVTLETRSEGGRAWKIVDQDNFYFDLREDILLDIIRHCGVGLNAEVTGKFIWAVVGSQTKLVRVDSGLHDELIEATKMHNAEKLSNKDLEPGDICKSKSGSIGIFLGWVAGKEIRVSPHWNNSNRYGYGFIPSNYKKRGLWWAPSQHEKNLGKKFIEKLEQTRPDRLYYESWRLDFTVKKSHAFRQKIGRLEVPSDVIEKVRLLGLRVCDWKKKEVSERWEERGYGWNGHSKDFLIASAVFPESSYYVNTASHLAWIRPAGEPEPTVTCFDDILGDFAMKVVKVK